MATLLDPLGRPIEADTKGEEAVTVRCKTHGTHNLKIPKDFPPEMVLGCPYCLRTMTSGKSHCGEGFVDERGVAYVVDVHGNIRHLDRLTDAQKRRIIGRRDLIRRGAIR